jgi:tetratricopeptide (TPR) repeat protein
VQEAVEQFNQALRINPKSSDAHVNLGLALSKMGRTDEALGHYEQALQIKPDDFEILFNMAILYANTHRSFEAIATAQKALDIARSRKQTVQAERIENWLNSCRASLSGQPKGPASLPAGSTP